MHLEFLLITSLLPLHLVSSLNVICSQRDLRNLPSLLYRWWLVLTAIHPPPILPCWLIHPFDDWYLLSFTDSFYFRSLFALLGWDGWEMVKNSQVLCPINMNVGVFFFILTLLFQFLSECTHIHAYILLFYTMVFQDVSNLGSPPLPFLLLLSNFQLFTILFLPLFCYPFTQTY